MTDRKNGTVASRKTATFRAAKTYSCRHISLVAAALLLSAPALAETVKFPKAEPKVAFDVPDGWVVETDETGLVVRSPEKNSIMVGQVLTRDKEAIESWRKKAAEKLKAVGVVFDSKPKSPAPATAAAPAAQTPVDFAKDANAFTFSGAPSLATPETSTVATPSQIGPNSLGALAPVGSGTAKPGKSLPFKSIEFIGTTIADKPVDAELIIYDVSPKRIFVVMQESNPDDNRSVAIAKSVRAAK